MFLAEVGAQLSDDEAGEGGVYAEEGDAFPEAFAEDAQHGELVEPESQEDVEEIASAGSVASAGRQLAIRVANEGFGESAWEV